MQLLWLKPESPQGQATDFGMLILLLQCIKTTKATKCCAPSIKICTLTSKRPHMHVKSEKGGMQNENKPC